MPAATTPRKHAGTPPKNLFGRWLLERGITSEDLARRMGYHVQAIRSWRGMMVKGGRLVPRRTPSQGALVLAASVLGFHDAGGLTGAQRVLRLIQTPVSE